MKKTIVIHITPSLMTGGAEKFLVSLLKEFQINPNNKFEHQVAYFQSGPNLKTLQGFNITTYHIQGIINHFDPICFIRLYRLIKKIKPTYIHSILWSANFYARIIGKILNIPVICSIHSNHNSGNINQDNKFKLILDQLSLDWASQITTVSNKITAKIKRNFTKISPAKITTINNGIAMPTKFFTKKNSTFTIGHVGRFVPVKNQILLIKALVFVKTKLPNFKAIIIGHGILEEQLKTLTKNLNLSNHVEFIKTNEVHKYYPKFDCFVLPSQQEGQSIALLEAMSFGVTPIITTNGSHEIIKQRENGLICQPNNILDLARSIIEIANNAELNKKLSTAALATVQDNFNLTSAAKKYLELYKHN